MPNVLRIEHLCGIIPKAQSWLVLNLPVFIYMFVCIHFSVAPTRITDLARNVSDESLLVWNSHLCLRFCFSQLGLCSVSYPANEYSIFHFCIMVKEPHFFFKSDCLSKTLKL